MLFSQASVTQARATSEMSSAADRVWKTQRYPDMIAELLEAKAELPPTILDLGCGVDEASEYADRVPTAHVLAIDANPTVIERASREFDRPNISYQVGDPLDRFTMPNLDESSIGVAVLTGLLTNIIDYYDLERLFHYVDTALHSGGYIVISDYLIQPDDKEAWHARYGRDLVALERAGLSGMTSRSLYGTIITRPFGYSAAAASELSVDDMFAALQQDLFERFARHWNPALLMSAINNGSNGHLQVRFARVQERVYDQEDKNGLATLNGVCLVLEKVTSTDPNQRQRLSNAIGRAVMSGGDHQHFFNILTQSARRELRQSDA
ncbi:MAG TPA: class I SAM-dependent methyltransferase [Candidatus Saccharimonadales bacterium]|nr:class I SAM-dependent methyltransferase [Candidatus Saccharimonadales bacterium]